MSKRRQKSVIVSIVALVIVAAILISGNFGAQLLSLLNVSHAQSPVVAKTQSGLVVADSLAGKNGTWTFWGDAIAKNATYSHFENSTGLYLGVKSANSGVWAGYYAAESTGKANVYHATLTLPYSKIKSGSFNTGLFVQTTIHPINYIACGAGVNTQGYYWEVVIGSGNPFAADNFQPVYYKWMNNQSLSQECTIITNGTNVLTVYLGNTEVYSNNSMNLQIPPPFTAYLAVETTSSQMLYASYTDFYATLGRTVTVLNAPAGGAVAIMDSSNKTIETAAVNPSSAAVLQLAANKPLPNGYIRVYNSNGTLFASTTQTATFWGGDIFSVRNG
ncbi:MAG: hypothetical protein M1587_06405 [Thaumarchaeota archaeon]|nr:hypothetical protein [Nitrososphaerota archaeon]